MSVFSPAARVTDPDGREWEIYAYRIQLPPRGEIDPGADDGTLLSGHGIGPIPNPFDGILYMLGKLLGALSGSSGTSRAPRSPRATRTTGRSRP